MAMNAGRWKKGRTKSFAGFAYTTNDVFLFDRVSHRDLHVPLKALAQSKPVIIVTFDSEVQNSAHAKALKFANVLFGRDLGPQIEKIGQDGRNGKSWYCLFRRGDAERSGRAVHGLGGRGSEGRKANWERAVGGGTPRALPRRAVYGWSE
jgi:hypothetical protein